MGKAELDVLKIVWERQPCSVQDVTAHLTRNREVARTTVLTVIQRLHKKGFLKRRKVNGLWHYEAVRSRKNVLSSLLRQFINATFEGSKTSLVQHLTEKKLTDQELAQIRMIIGHVAAEGKKNEDNS